MTCLSDHRYSDFQNVAFSPDGKQVYAVTFEEVRVYDAQSCALVRVFEKGLPLTNPPDLSRGLTVSPDGIRLAARNKVGEVLIWEGGELVVRRKVYSDRVDGLSFSPDGRLLVTNSWDGTTTLLNSRDGAEIVRRSSRG